MTRVVLVTALLLMPSAASGQTSPTWAEPMSPVRIADGFYYVGTVGLSAFLVTSDDGHILIDATLEENVPLLLANIRAVGADPSDIRIHLATHAHWDHVAGFASLIEATGGALWVSEADAPFIASGRDFGFDSDGYDPAPVARTLRHQEAVRLGDVEMTALVTPGHTPGCTSWTGTVVVEGEPKRFVLVCSLSVLPQYRIVGASPTYEGHGSDYCASLAQLEALTPDIFLSNHGSFFNLTEKAAAAGRGDARAFVDPQSYRTFLQQARAGIERALAAQGHEGGCATLVRNGG